MTEALTKSAVLARANEVLKEQLAYQEMTGTDHNQYGYTFYDPEVIVEFLEYPYEEWDESELSWALETINEFHAWLFQKLGISAIIGLLNIKLETPELLNRDLSDDVVKQMTNYLQSLESGYLNLNPVEVYKKLTEYQKLISERVNV